MKHEFMLGTMYWLNPNYSAEEIDKDLRQIKENNFNIIRTFIWWEKTELKEDEFDFTQHDILFAAAEKHNLKIMATFGLYLPPWRQASLLEAGIDDRDKRYPCFDRPEVAVPMQRFIEETVKRYKNSPALLIWNLWNEPTKSPCKCPSTLEKFEKWLKERYKSIESLRKAWLGEFQVFCTICPESFEELNVKWLKAAFETGSRGRISPMEYDWHEFATDNLTENITWLRDIVRALDPTHETHANPASPTFNSIHCGLNEWKLGKALDSLSVSMHPSHLYFQLESIKNFPTASSFCIDEARSWSKKKSVWIGELQAGTTFYHSNTYTPSATDISHDLWQALGRGMQGVLFWEWQGWRSSMMEVGEFSLRRAHDGGPTERSEAAAKFGATLKKLASILVNAECSKAKVAIFASMNARNLKYLQFRAKPHLNEFENEHTYALYGCYKALNKANIAVDFISEIEIEAGILGDYDVVFAPHVEIMSGTTAAKLVQFVAEGGALWADGRFAFLDEHVYLRKMIPGHDLDKLFGCREADFIALRDKKDIVLNDGRMLSAYRHIQYLEPVEGEIRGTHLGHPAIIRNKFGKGTAELNGTYCSLGIQKEESNQAMAYIAGFALEHGAKPVADISPADKFECSRLESKDHSIIIISNRSSEKEKALIKVSNNEVELYNSSGKEKFIKVHNGLISYEFESNESTVFLAAKA